MRKLAATFAVAIPKFQLSEIRFSEMYLNQREKNWRRSEYKSKSEKVGAEMNRNQRVKNPAPKMTMNQTGKISAPNRT